MLIRELSCLLEESVVPAPADIKHQRVPSRPIWRITHVLPLQIPCAIRRQPQWASSKTEHAERDTQEAFTFRDHITVEISILLEYN